MKRLCTVFVILLIMIALVFFAKDMIVKTIISGAVKAATGLHLNIENMKVDIFKSRIGIEGLKLYNPQGFKDRVMVDMPEIFVAYDAPALLKGKAHFSQIRIHLKEFVVVRNEAGQLNLDSLKIVKGQGPAKTPKEKKKEIPEFQIDDLKLKIGRVIYKDYSKKARVKTRIYNINISENYKNITTTHTLVALIVVKALMKTTISSLANFDVGPLMEGVKATLKGVGRVVIDSADKAVDVGLKVGTKAKDVAQEAVDTLKQILPLGK